MTQWIDVKYIQMVGSQLELFKPKKADLWNFRCPYCGDSEKDRTKARGYLFHHKGDYKFKCHNCGHSCYFSSFLKHVDQNMHKEYRMELFKENSGGKTRKPVEKKPKFKRKRPVSKPKVELPDELDGLQPVSELDEKHFIRRYVEERMIPKSKWNWLFWVKEMRVIADRLSGYDETHFDRFPRLLLPFIDKEGKLTHIQGRAVGDNVPKKSRYYTLEVEEDTPKVYGFHSIDPAKQVLVVEGPIDSLFLSNCTGMGGADVPWNLYEPSKTTFVWDNEPRSKVITKHMREAVDRGFSVCVWGKNIREKDINDMVLAGRSPEWLDDYISNHTFKGLKAKMAISQYEI